MRGKHRVPLFLPTEPFPPCVRPMSPAPVTILPPGLLEPVPISKQYQFLSTDSICSTYLTTLQHDNYRQPAPQSKRHQPPCGQRPLQHQAANSAPVREVQGAKAIIRRVRGPVFGKPQGSRSKKLRGGRQNIDRGVSHPGLKAELIRHPPDNICDAIQLARSYEATLELEPQLHALKITADPGPRQLPPGNRNNRPRNRMNPYRCVHNPPIRPTGDPLSFCNLVPIISHISHSTPPLRISGYPDKRPVRFLVDTGASCSVRVVHRPKQWEQRYFLSASGDQFYCAPVIWEAILGMDFLKKYESSIDFTSGQITFDNPCQPNPDVLSPAPPETKHGLTELLNEFSTSFDTHRSKLGRTHILQHTIDTGHHHTGHHHPIYQTPCRIPINYRAQLDAMIQEILDDGIIRPSSSPWASPIVLAKKKDGNLRMGVDYRK
ncbi:hypothetical protein T265_06870 [Opisthorchis viverrini]|uniref:Peptidase A2 domain-containing protein n=1 Tax=Opisthorchis viverrini TaxID=6198 RepID=A0A074ZIW1_OPIVI|nr:hypothetical protein T265_06870 [Opisthorchis viverrini]KER25692.1 hypothetical protein T265_06870 [Opisthorchis viverrini]